MRLVSVVWVIVPLVPVIVIGYVPGGVEADVDTVRSDVVDVLVGLKTPDAPAGNPDADRLTAPAPPVGATDTVYVVPVPAGTDREEGDADIEKSGDGADPQPGKRNEVIQVLQFHVPLPFRYSVVYQKVQSSTGSTVIEL